MTRFKALVYRRRIALVAILSFAFLALSVLGGVRLYSWTRPVAQGNYSQAAPNAQSPSDEAALLYDRALALYNSAETDRNPDQANQDMSNAQTLLQSAYNSVLDAGHGTVLPADAKLASAIEFRLGNILVLEGLSQQSAQLINTGVDDYKQCLRLDPTNMYAKYNIELLEQSNKVNGKDNPSGPGKKGDQQGSPKPGQQPGGSQAGHTHNNGT